jgi:hypothetical protein
VIFVGDNVGGMVSIDDGRAGPVDVVLKDIL